MIKHKYFFGLLVFWLFLCLSLFHIIYNEAKERAIDDLNSRQMIHARQAKRGIEDFFANAIKVLSRISNSVNRLTLNDTGMDDLNLALNINQEDIKAVTLVDVSGKIIYTLPHEPSVIGKDISQQKHVKKILKTHMPVVSDVFNAVQGYPAVALHVPVFKKNEFQGTVAILIDFLTVSRRFLEEIRLGETGYAWMVSEEGIELYCPVPGHVGKSVFENCKEFSTIISMAKEMLKGREGVTTYVFNMIRDKQITKIKKHAVYLPIKIADTFWSIVVASSEDEILAPLVSFKNKLIMIFALLFFGSGFFSYYAMKGWGIVKEAAKRQKAEHAMQSRMKELDCLYRLSRLIETPGISLEDILQGAVLLVPEGCQQPDIICAKIVLNGGVYKTPNFEDTEWTLSREFLVEGNAVGKLEIRRLKQRPQADEGPFLREEKHMITAIAERLQHVIERKKMDKTLEQQKAQYHSLFEKMLDGFALHEIICDDDGNPVDYRFIHVNPAFEKLTGLKESEIIGRTVMDVLPETENHWIQKYGNVALTGEPVFFEDYSSALGKYFEVTAYRPAPGQFACIFVDTTERKKMMEHLQQAQKMEAIGTLAGGIAHDFNNILFPLMGYAEMLKENIPEGSQSRRYVDEILKAALRSKDLIQQILSFSRQGDEDKKPMKLQPIIKEALKLLRSSIPTTIDMRQNIDPACDAVIADPTQVHQIIMNLATNAYHAMEKTGGTLSVTLKQISMESGQPLLTDLMSGEYACMTVTDTGAGIKKELLNKVFDPYFTTKKKGKGTGLGLSVVQGIVKSCNGDIRIYSEPGKGTEIRVYLPTIKKVALNKNIDQSLPIKRGNERILLVDDEEPIIRMEQMLLERLGYTVTTRTGSLEALDTFKARPCSFDIVITDMTMPRMTGEKLSVELIKIRHDIPIVLCTGFSEILSPKQAEKAGIRAVLSKPIMMKDISNKIREILDK